METVSKKYLHFFIFLLWANIFCSGPVFSDTSVTLRITVSKNTFNLGERVTLQGGTYSGLFNSSSVPVTGSLLLRIDRWHNNTWEQEELIYSNGSLIIPGNVTQALTILWNTHPWYVNKTGLYRVYGEFISGSTILAKTALFNAVVTELDVTNETLIVYNTNSTDSYDIAAYYASRRNIATSRLCPVALPTGQFASAAELLGARKTIIENCICGVISQTVPASEIPNPCSVSNLDAIAQVSPITHIALIRGIPPRLYGTGWPHDPEGGSFDFYLTQTLYGNDEIFNAGGDGTFPTSTYYGNQSDEIDLQPASALDGYIRPIQPALDRVIAYGRIEAITKERTLELIDRTLRVEADGMEGNFISGYSGVESSVRAIDALKSLSSSSQAACGTYYEEGNSGEWPYWNCRAGITRGELPGESGSSVPMAINASLYLNREFDDNGQLAFDGFNNMLDWRRSDQACTPLCSDLGDANQISLCRQNSKDYFKELNTDCVGTAPGFMGFQLRSWTTQYYGFWPQGWGMVNGGNGAYEKTPPVILTTGGFQDSKFTDGNYLHYGALDAAANPQCLLENGALAACPEKIAVDLAQGVTVSPSLPISGSRTFTVKFRHRNAATASPGGWVRLIVKVRFDGSSEYSTRLSPWIDLTQANGAWTTKQYSLTLNDTGLSLNRFILELRSNLDSAPAGSLDLDAFEFIDNATGQDHLNLAVNSFTAPLRTTNPGDYAANAIDRLGGIAWWGSSSHFLSQGGSFGRIDEFVGGFFSGRTLGETLRNIDDVGSRAGIIYGDPLYRPAGAKLYLNEGFESFNDAARPYRFYETRDDSRYINISINAFHGHDRYLETQWDVSACYNSDITACDDNQTWRNFRSGTGGVIEEMLFTDLMEFIDDPLEDENIILRLRVWNSDEPEKDLKNYGFLRYESGYNAAYHFAISQESGEKPKVSSNRVVWLGNDCSGIGCKSVHVYNLDTHQESKIAEDFNISELAIDGNDLVWANMPCCNYKNHVRHYSFGTGTTDLDLTLGSSGNKVAVSNRRIAFTDSPSNDAPQNRQIFVYDLTTGIKTQLTFTSGSKDDLDIDDQTIVWSDLRNNANREIYMRSLTGSESQVTSAPVHEGSPIIHGNYIMWSDYNHSTASYEIFSCSKLRNGQPGGCLATDAKTPIAVDPSVKMYHSTSGGRAVWSGGNFENMDIYTTDLSGAAIQVVHLINEPGSQEQSDLHGNVLVYRNGDDMNRIYVYTIQNQPPNAENLIPLNGSSSTNRTPTFSAQVTDDMGLSLAKIWLDDQLVSAQILQGNNAAVTYRHPSALSYGYHTYEIRVWDSAGTTHSDSKKTRFRVKLFSGSGGGGGSGGGSLTAVDIASDTMQTA